jgi:protein-S-isoprenylcysteine O-methyltransferase Ste14
MLLAGLGLALQSWIAFLIDVAIFGVVYGYRMLAEERILVRKLGGPYIDYMKRTKRVIPFIV